MINHEAVLLAARVKLATLSVATTGAISVAATTTTYTRTTGSFLTDGFAPGMEVAGTSFTNDENNDAKVITAVTTLVITCTGNVAESAATRTLTVGEPVGVTEHDGVTVGVASENVHFEPTPGEPYFEENYLPGPMSQITVGDNAELEIEPLYVLKVFVPANIGMTALRKYADALITLFAPTTELPVTGHTVRVRGNPAPFSGQILPVDGYSFLSVTVPLSVRTTNSI